MPSRFSFARVNTYTNAAGETITEHMTPEYRKPTDFNDPKEWSDDEDIPVLSRKGTPEHEGELLLDGLVLSREVSPSIECEQLSGWSSREVSPDAECIQLSGWSDIEASSDAFVKQSSLSSSREVPSEHAWGQSSLPSSKEVTAEPVTYYTPQASDPDFDCIPLHEKRPAVSEHDRNHAEVDDWDTITSREDLDPDVYTKITASDGTVIYRKPPYQTDLSEEVGTIGNPASAHLDGFRVCCNPNEGGPPPLGEVHLVFEVSPDNKPHPKSWLGLPTTCLYEDASRAETLALRIEWKNEKGETQSEYLRYTHSPLLFSTVHEGQYDGLGVAIGILNHLENREIVQNKRPFLRDFGKAHMLTITVDFFLQTITVQEYLDFPQKFADAGVRRCRRPQAGYNPSGADRCRSRERRSSVWDVPRQSEVRSMPGGPHHCNQDRWK
jgi:hypothetical protein